VEVFSGVRIARRLVIVALLVLVAGCSTDADGTASKDRPRTAAPEGFEHRAAAVNGVRLHYVIGGKGPAVVLLHGFPETWYAWRNVMPTLAEEHTVIAPDLRGIGDSSLEESGYDKETLAEDVHGLVRSLGFEEVSVVGHDMGAMTAYAYAREHRGETSHLVLMGAALPGFGLEEFMDFSSPKGSRYHLVFFQQRGIPEKLIEGQERYYLERFTGGEAVVGAEALDEYVRAYSRPGRLEAALGQYRAIYGDAEDNRRKAMPKLEMPVLALGGGSAEPALGSARRVAEDVEAGAVPNAGHYLHEERPEEVAGRLLDFLD
jgi:pimeloyl-ACP methyl ester carboxylesterase